MPSDEPEEISPENEHTHRQHAADPLRYATLGAFVLGALAVGALTVVTVSALTRTDVNQPTSAPTTTVTSAVTESTHASETINPAVTQTITIPFPRLGGVGRYHQDGVVAMFGIAGDHCGTREGMIGASGTIRNESPAGQTFDYIIEVDLIRVWTRARIGHLEATVTGLAPGASADWSVEIPSTRVSAIDCEVTDVTLTPID
ncbi:MAG: hypothetical protein IIC70_02195 [Acidobacteria bacterium]|nr:hypothetical protein [Acidobacteriota bacterium]